MSQRVYSKGQESRPYYTMLIIVKSRISCRGGTLWPPGGGGNRGGNTGGHGVPLQIFQGGVEGGELVWEDGAEVE